LCEIEKSKRPTVDTTTLADNTRRQRRPGCRFRTDIFYYRRTRQECERARSRVTSPRPPLARRTEETIRPAISRRCSRAPRASARPARAPAKRPTTSLSRACLARIGYGLPVRDGRNRYDNRRDPPTYALGLRGVYKTGRQRHPLTPTVGINPPVFPSLLRASSPFLRNAISKCIRPRGCFFQSCPNNTDFRETQCSSFNEKLFNGQKYTWSAYYHGTYFERFFRRDDVYIYIYIY